LGAGRGDEAMASYYQRHYGTNKPYVAIDKDGKVVGVVQAYNATEARKELRDRGVKFAKLVRS
jgi:hypothetical protein